MSRFERVSQISEHASDSGAPAWLPETARRILLVSGSETGSWGATAAVELAEMVARHRPRTLFVNTVTGPSNPDADLSLDGRPGLVEVASGRSRVSEVAVTLPVRSFIVIPAGRSKPVMSEVSRTPAFRHLVQAAGRGGTLLIHVRETDLASLLGGSEEAPGLRFDGIVLLGEPPLPHDLPEGLALLARVEQEDFAHPSTTEPVTRGAASGFSRPSATPPIVVSGDRSGLSGRLERLVEDVRSRPAGGSAAGGSRKGPRGPVGRWADDARKRALSRGVAGVAAVWVVAALVVWLVWQGLSGWPAFEDDFEVPAQARSSVSEAPPPAAADVAADSTAVDSEGAPQPDRRQGVALPYSVLVASYVTYEDAADKRDELLDTGDLAFVAPTPVRGRLYYRVFAGALEDRVRAAELMLRLVSRGDKERERDWDMRPAGLAFTLGDFPSEDEAIAERDRLHGLGVPAYVLSVGDATGAIFRLYSGAFESEAAADPADAILSGAGEAATLVTRRGEPT